MPSFEVITVGCSSETYSAGSVKTGFALRRQLKFYKAGHRQGGGRNRELFRAVRNLENVRKTAHCCEAGDGMEKKKRNQFDVTLLGQFLFASRSIPFAKCSDSVE